LLGADIGRPKLQRRSGAPMPPSPVEVAK